MIFLSSEQCTEIKLVLSMDEAVNMLDHDDLREYIWEKMPHEAQSEWLKKMIRRRELEIGQKDRYTPCQKWTSMAEQEYRVLKLLSKLGPVSMIELKQNPECPSFSAFDKAFMDRLISFDEHRKYYVTKRGEQFIAIKENR